MLPSNPEEQATSTAYDSSISESLYREDLETTYVRTDRLFACLLALQWLGLILVAWIADPGKAQLFSAELGAHFSIAVIGGGLLAGFPIALVYLTPGRLLTRVTISIAQLCFSGLLIHVTNGRIESHFHIFGSLAFLSAYRDWRVILVPTVITAADHFARGVWWPASIFGESTYETWRWVEHAGWVVFEDIILFLIIRQDLGRRKTAAIRHAQLKRIHAVALASEQRAHACFEQASAASRLGIGV